MYFTDEQYAKIKSALDAKVKHCPTCQDTHGVIMPGIHLIGVNYPPLVVGEPDSFIPCVLTCCMNCGLTNSYNVHVLGLAEILGIPAPGEPIPKGTPNV